MKKLYVLIVICALSISSCTSDDGTTRVTQKLFKKIERYKGGLFFDVTVDYNSNNQIESIVIIKYKPVSIGFTKTISVAYDANTVTSIREVTQGSNQDVPPQVMVYDVSSEGNTIFLTSEDFRIEIAHSNGYVDSLRKIYLENMLVLKESYLTRDSNQNLTSYTFSGGNVVNNYSDFDTDKKVDPRGVVIDVAYRDFIDIFDLKLTKNNPQTSRQDILSSVGRPQTYSYEYDEEGYIIRTYDFNGLNYVDTFYIEQ